MRDNINTCDIEGYVYDISKLSKKVSSSTAKNPGTTFITGELEIVVDEEGVNVIPVHFSYVTEVYSKSKKINNTFTVLNQLLEGSNNTWLSGGKENAIKVKISGSILLNDFISNGERVSVQRCEGSFVNIVNTLSDIKERNKFKTDIVITKVKHVDANPEKNIKEDYVALDGVIFNYRKDLLPVHFVVRNEHGMKYFENLGVSNQDPLYTNIWGHFNSQTIKAERKEESAWGEMCVQTFETKNKEWVITGTAKVPYDFGDEKILTKEDLEKGMQDREIYWADVEKKNSEYLATKNNKSTDKIPTSPVQSGGFSF